VTATEEGASPASAPHAAPPPGNAGQDTSGQRPAPAPGHVPEQASPDLSRLATILGRIVAPTTLLTALLYYFGWAHAYFFFGYFGVNSTVLGFSTADYLMRSVDALFVPVTVVAIIALLALWGNAVLRLRITDESRQAMRRFLIWAIAAAGLALAITGGLLTFVGRTALNQYAATAPVGFGVGVLLLAYAVHLWRSFPVRSRDGPASSWAATTEWMIAFALVGISLFAAATDYAADVGQARARHFASVLSTQPNVMIYSERSLSLHQPGVSEVQCRGQRTAYGYRYSGLKLLLESGGKYLLLPQGWSIAHGGAILIAQSDSLRLEFYPASSLPSSTTAC